MQCLQLGYESGRGKHKQTSSSCDGALRPIQILELGYEPCPGERKQAWQLIKIKMVSLGSTPFDFDDDLSDSFRNKTEEELLLSILDYFEEITLYLVFSSNC